MNITSADSNSPADRAANLPSKSHLLLKVAGRHAGLNLSLSLDQALKQRVNRESTMRTRPGNYTSLLSPGQFKMAYIILYSESPHALYPVSENSPALPLKTVPTQKATV